MFLLLQQQKLQIGGKGSPSNMSVTLELTVVVVITKPRQPSKPIPVGQGVGDPWKSVDYQLSYLLEDLSDKSALFESEKDRWNFFNYDYW